MSARTHLRCWLLPLLLFAAAAPAGAVTVTRTPGSACTSAGTGGNVAWTNPGRASADDNSFATVDVDGTISRHLSCQNYGFTIPAGATINGITVWVSRFSSSDINGGSRDAEVFLIKGGVLGSTNRATSTTYTTTEVSEAHGSSTDLWGQAWTAADINATNFGVAFSATKPGAQGQAHTIAVDVISVSVDYTPGDTTPPTATSIVRASANPTNGATASWTVTFSESVTGVDSGDFSLVVAGLSGTSITSVTGSGTTWTVTANTGSGAGTLGLNLVDNDSIVDAAGNALGGAGSGNGNRTGEVYTVDKVAPTVLSPARAGTNPSNAASLAWTVTFSESVTGVDTGDFALATTGTASASITSVTGSGTTWTVTATGVAGTGTLGLNLVDNDSIVDGLSNRLGGTGIGNGNATGQVYTVDRNSPAVSSITRVNASPAALDELTWTVTFSESVTGVTSADFSLVTSGLAGASITAVSGTGTTRTVTVNPGYGAGTVGLNLVDDDSIVDALGNALGGTGAGNGNFTGEVYAVTTPPLASYLFEEASWNGSADQVADSQGGNPGTARNGATTASQSPALGGSPGTCRYGVFTSPSTPTVSNGYVDLKASFPYQTDSFTLAAWVRTTSNSTADQWIFKHNTTGTGYALSLGTAGAGRLRFTSGGSATPNLDSPATAGSLLANDTWYFVAAVADFSSAPNIVRRLYVYNAAGSLLSGYPVTVTATGWGGTESGAATLGGDGSSSVRGFVDDVRLFGKVLDAAALTGLAQERHTCTTVAPDHYEIAMDTSSIACMPTPVTVTACADSSSPCTSPFTSASGRTVTLATSAGALGTTVLTLDAAGTASTTLAHGGAADGTSVTVTLSSVETIANNATRCCADGTSCSAASSCSTTFSTAGFIFAASAGGAAATVPAQTAGTTSGNFVLRAVKTSTTTAACVSALSGANTVDWAYECNDPSTCSGSNLMSVNGGSSTTVARNNNGSVGSYTSVPMSFDANGNANFNFTFNDVGRATLRVRKTVNSALLQGASDAFVSKPAGFTVTGIAQTAAPNTANPGATGPTGGVFVKAGEAFRATVTATTSTGAAAPNFGKESSPEGVSLTRALVLPAGGSSGALSNGTVAGGNFTNGVATVTNLAFSEVGVIRLSPAVADGNYLGAGTATGTTTGNIGRFVPARFALSSAALTHRAAQACAPASAYTYLDENFSLTMTLTAQNTAGATTSNYTGSFARFDATAVGSWGLKGIAGTTVFISEPSGRLSLGSASGSWANGVLAGATLSATGLRSSAPDGPFDVAFGVAPSDADGTVLASYDLDTDQPANGNDRLTVATVALRFGRLRLHNAIGAADRSLALPLRAESWNGSAFALNTLDSCSRVPTTAVNLGRRRGSLIASDVAPAGNVTLANGAGRLVLTAPGGGRSGTLDAALSLGSAADTACGGTWAPSPAATAGAGLAALRSNWCSTAYSHDPTARATFGRQRGNSNTVYRRESF